MLDRTKPPPNYIIHTFADGHQDPNVVVLNAGFIPGPPMTLDVVWEVYTEESRPAVVDFAETVAAWMGTATFRTLLDGDAADDGYPDIDAIAEAIVAFATHGTPLPGSDSGG